MEKILSISLKLNFTPNTLSYYGIMVKRKKIVFSNRKSRQIPLFDMSTDRAALETFIHRGHP